MEYGLDSITSAFAASPVFGQLSAERLAEVCGRIMTDGGATVREFAAGERIAPADGGAFGVMLDGRASVSRAGSGDGRVILNILTRGSCLGVCSIFSGGFRIPPTVTTAGERCAVLFIGEEAFKRLLYSDSELCEAYIRFLTGRICFLNEKLYAFSGSTVNERVAQALLSGAVFEDDVLCCRGSMSELARRLNIGRASLYRALDAMEEGGMISRSGKCITLLDTEAISCFI